MFSQYCFNCIFLFYISLWWQWSNDSYRRHFLSLHSWPQILGVVGVRNNTKLKKNYVVIPVLSLNLTFVGKSKNRMPKYINIFSSFSPKIKVKKGVIDFKRSTTKKRSLIEEVSRSFWGNNCTKFTTMILNCINQHSKRTVRVQNTAILVMGVRSIFSRRPNVEFCWGGQRDFSRGNQQWGNFILPARSYSRITTFFYWKFNRKISNFGI